MCGQNIVYMGVFKMKQRRKLLTFLRGLVLTGCSGRVNQGYGKVCFFTFLGKGHWSDNIVMNAYARTKGKLRDFEVYIQRM